MAGTPQRDLKERRGNSGGNLTTQAVVIGRMDGGGQETNVGGVMGRVA